MFFISYLLAVALVGNFAEFLALPTSFIAWLKYRYAITSEERERAKAYFQEPFLFGFQYAYQGMFFCMCIIYSTVVPMLIPFVLVTLVIKYFVDKHHLVYINRNDKSDQHIIKTQMRFILSGVVMYQVVMGCFFYFRSSLIFSIVSLLMVGFSFIVAVVIAFARTVDEEVKEPSLEDDQILLNENIIDGKSYRNPILLDKTFRKFINEYSSFSTKDYPGKHISVVFKLNDKGLEANNFLDDEQEVEEVIKI